MPSSELELNCLDRNWNWSGIAFIGIGIGIELPLGLGTGFGIGVELPLSELELEFNCKNGIDPISDPASRCHGVRQRGFHRLSFCACFQIHY